MESRESRFAPAYGTRSARDIVNTARQVRALREGDTTSVPNDTKRVRAQNDAHATSAQHELRKRNASKHNIEEHDKISMQSIACARALHHGNATSARRCTAEQARALHDGDTTSVPDDTKRVRAQNDAHATSAQHELRKRNASKHNIEEHDKISMQSIACARALHHGNATSAHAQQTRRAKKRVARQGRLSTLHATELVTLPTQSGEQSSPYAQHS